MASDNLVAFIIGAGPNVGSAVAAKLQGGGYKVAVGSRNPKAEEGYFPVKLDIEDRKSVLSALDTVNKELGPDYAESGIKFYFPSLVSKEGGYPDYLGEFRKSGPVHAKVFWDLINNPGRHEDWDFRFTIDGSRLVSKN